MAKTTIVLPVSRSTFLDKVFHSLEMLICDRNETNLLAIVDGDQNLFVDVRNRVALSKFNQRLAFHRKKGIPSSGTIRKRRQRIADIHNEVKDLIADCDYVFSVEDDTLYPPTTLKELFHTLSIHPHAGFVSGIELGRWGYPHIGAWHADNVYEPKAITSLTLNGNESIYAVDAAGFYCMLTTREQYVAHDFAPFKDALGPDVNYGLWLRQLGMMNYVTAKVRCTHLMNTGELNFQNTQPITVRLKKHDTLESWSVEVVND